LCRQVARGLVREHLAVVRVGDHQSVLQSVKCCFQTSDFLLSHVCARFRGDLVFTCIVCGDSEVSHLQTDFVQQLRENPNLRGR
jgi:hypothetical protein